MSPMRSLPWNRWLQLSLTMLALLAVIALVLSGVQQAREAARRTQWRNNLKQLGLAFHNYHDSFGQFPLGGTFSAEGTPHHSWTSFLMPYIDASPWYNSVNFQLPWDDPRQMETFLVFRRDYSPYRDPSVTTPLVRPDGLSDTHCSANSWLLHRNFGTSIGQITTGTSNTLLAGDARQHYWPFGHPTNWRNIEIPLNSSPDEFGHSCRPVFFMLMADGSVRVEAVEVDPAVLSALAGPETLRPKAEQVARSPWPYQRPPGGYWRTDQLGEVSEGEYRSLGLAIRYDSEGVPREVSRTDYEKGGRRLGRPNDLEVGPLDSLIPLILQHPTINRVKIDDSISDTAVAQLRELPELRTLIVGGGRITDRTLEHLADFPALEDLTLSYTGISDEGLRSVHGFPYLRRITLHIDDIVGFSPEGMMSFLADHPRVAVKVRATGRRGQHNWYWHVWTRCEIASLAVQHVGFGDPDHLSPDIECPCDALRPQNVPVPFDW